MCGAPLTVGILTCAAPVLVMRGLVPPPPPALPSLLCVGQLSHVALIIGHVKRELHGYALLKDAITSANASSSGGVSAARPLRCCSRCVPAPLQAAEQLALPAYAGRFHRVRGRF
jgi:hypothetical protein